jgi:hypothetical protein
VEEPAFLSPLEQGLSREAWQAFQEASAVQREQQQIADEAEAEAAAAARAGARAQLPRLERCARQARWRLAPFGRVCSS